MSNPESAGYKLIHTTTFMIEKDEMMEVASLKPQDYKVVRAVNDTRRPVLSQESESASLQGRDKLSEYRVIMGRPSKNVRVLSDKDIITVGDFVVERESQGI